MNIPLELICAGATLFIASIAGALTARLLHHRERRRASIAHFLLCLARALQHAAGETPYTLRAYCPHCNMRLTLSQTWRMRDRRIRATGLRRKEQAKMLPPVIFDRLVTVILWLIG